MERDFLSLGLKSWNDQTMDGSKDSVVTMNSRMQWSFANKVSAVPQFLSFKATQEEKPRKTFHDRPASPGFMTVSSADGFEAVRRHNFSAVKVGNDSPVTMYSPQHISKYTVYNPQKARMFPSPTQPNQTISVAMGGGHFQSHNAAGSTINTLPLGGLPNLGLVYAPSTVNTSVGTTDLRNSSRPAGGAGQMTIFYAGTVNVYDDVPPERVQAIMLQAGNGSPTSQNKTLPTAEVQSSSPKPALFGEVKGDQSLSPSSFSCLPGPKSFTSPAVVHPGGSGNSSEVATMKPAEPPGISSSGGSASRTLCAGVALPQARKASLARFLEKRKDRVTSTCPYSINKKYPGCSASGSEGLSLSMNSSLSSPPAAINKP